MSAPRVEAAPLSSGTVRAASAPRCESCGGPAEQGDLCASCRQAFQTVLDASAASGAAAEPAAAPEPPAQAHGPHANRLNRWLQTADSLAGEVEEPWTLSTQVAWELERWPAPQPAADIEALPAVPAGQLRLTFDDASSAATAAPDRGEPAGERAEEIDDAVVAALRKTLAKPVEEPAHATADAVPSPAAPPRPARVLAPAFARKPAQPAASAGRTPSRAITTAAAAVVVIAAVGFPVLTKLRAGAPPEPAAVVAEAPAPAAPKPAAESAPAANVPAPARTEPERAAEPPRLAKSRPDRPKGRSAARKPQPKIELPAPRPPEAAPAPAAVAVAQPVVEAPPPPPAPVAPVGPLFEMRDVHVPPKIVTRVEPVVPAGVPGPVNEIVVVRVLVSQTGRPSMARLLRASKTGPAIDDAVIQAVHQWTFVPAQRRGGPVSCWYHVGVPVRGR
jgi:TonB family protein